MDLNLLLKKAEDYKPMTAGNFNLSNVYGFGERVRESVAGRSGISPTLDLHALIKGNGGEIHYIDYACFKTFGERNIFEKSIYVHGEQQFDIVLPAYAALIENRYTIAHELAHYVLHSKTGECFARRNGDGAIEREADCFALGFLMPSELFKTIHRRCEGDLNELSIVFLVPTDAVNARIKSLNLCQK
ncbi:hypothetical protein FACS189443_1740 [Planctomycetales bacterium]|nr:hypothetical protein FACS189443_1740 [Planctomycetales bacterium]